MHAHARTHTCIFQVPPCRINPTWMSPRTNPLFKPRLNNTRLQLQWDSPSPKPSLSNRFLRPSCNNPRHLCLVHFLLQCTIMSDQRSTQSLPGPFFVQVIQPQTAATRDRARMLPQDKTEQSAGHITAPCHSSHCSAATFRRHCVTTPPTSICRTSVAPRHENTNASWSSVSVLLVWVTCHHPSSKISFGRVSLVHVWYHPIHTRRFFRGCSARP